MKLTDKSTSQAHDARHFIWSVLALIWLLCLPFATSRAGSFNIGAADGSFETGLSGMETSGDVGLVRGLGILQPTQGSQAAVLTTRPDAGSTLADADVSVLRIENFTVPAGVGTLRLDYNFLTNEPNPSFTNDQFTVELLLLTGGGEEQLLAVDTFSTFYPATWTGYNGHTGFHKLVADVSAYAGRGELLTLKLRIADVGDGRKDSAIFIDNLQFAAPGEPIARVNQPYVATTPSGTVVFDGSGSTDADGTLTDYRWDFGNGVIGIGPIVPYAFPQEGIQRVRLTVTDDAGNTSTQDIPVVVGAINHPPTITSTPVTAATENFSYRYQVTVSDPELAFGDVMQYALTTAPTGMTIDPASGLITWMPTTAAPRSNDVTVQVQDSQGLTATQTFKVIIGPEIYVIASDDNGALYHARSNGDGSFANFQFIDDTGSNTRGAAIADFDHDGDFDFISGHASGNTQYLYFYERQGTRLAPPAFIGTVGDATNPSGSYMMDMAAGDFDNNGSMDLIVNSSGSSVWLLQNRGVFQFAEENFFASNFEVDNGGWGGAQCATSFARDNTTAAQGNWSMRVFATGSSCLSIAITPSNWNLFQGPSLSFAYRIPRGVPVGLLFNVSNKGWLFLGGSPAAKPGTYPAVATASLIDDDQWHTATVDIYAAIKSYWPDAGPISRFQWWTGANVPAGNQFWFDDFRVTRRMMTTGFEVKLLPSTGGDGRGIDSGDVDQDGNLDFVRARTSDGAIYLYRGDGKGNFTPSTSGVADPGSDPYGVALADFDGDGKVDLIANNASSGDPYFYKGNGSGSFQTAVTVPSLDTNNYTAYGAYDFNSDGKQDIVAVNYSGRQVLYYSGQGSGTFGAPVTIGTTTGSTLGIAAPAGRVVGQPFAYFSQNAQEVNQGDTVHFDAGASYDDGSIADYHWDFGDGTGTGVSLDHTYLKEGNYQVVLTVTDNTGSQDRAGVKIRVVGSPPVANPGGPYVFGEDIASNGRWVVQLDGSASADAETGISRYEWDFDATNGLGVDSTEPKPRRLYTAPGVYTVTLTVYDGIGQKHTATTTVTIGIGTLPTAVLTGPAAVDETTASLGQWTVGYDLSASSDDQGIARYQIDWGDNSSTTVATALKDDFEDGDLTTNPAWTLTRGSWAVIDGQVQQTQSNTSNQWVWLQDRTASYRDFELEVDFQGISTGNGYMGIAFRNSNAAASTDSLLLYSQDNWNYWRFYDWNTDTTIKDGGSGWDPGKRYHLRLRVVGGHLQLFVTPQGGVETLQLEADYGSRLSGGIALLAYNQQLIYDNLKVTPIEDSLRPVHVFTAAGTYPVKLTVTDHAGQTHSATQTTQVSAGAAPVAQAGGPYALDEFDAWDGRWDFILNAGGSTDDVEVQRWTVDFGDGIRYSSGFATGIKGSYFATGTDLYGYDVPVARLYRVIATEDSTDMEIINLATKSVIASTRLNRFQSWDTSPGDGVYFKVRASKPVVAYLTNLGDHSAFAPSMDGSPAGREFIFQLDNTSGFYVFAMDDALVRFFNTNGTLAAQEFLRAGSYWKPNLGEAIYRVVASGRITLQTVGNNGYTTVPSATGDGAERLFYFAVRGGTTGAMAVFAHEAATLQLFDLDTGQSLYVRNLLPGELWYQNGLGTRRLRLVSSGDVELWAGDTEGGTAITDLGDDISIAGGRDGTDFRIHTLRDGLVIFAPNNGTQLSIDNGALTKTLNRDEYLALSPDQFPRGAGVHRIQASQPIFIQTLGRASGYNDLGTWLGGVSQRHRYTQPGDYTVTVTAIDRAGQSNTTTATVQVQAGAKPIAIIDAPAVVNETYAVGGNWTVHFDAGRSSDDSAIIRYVWNFGDGGTATDVVAPTHVYTQPGTYNVTLTVTDRAGQQTTVTFPLEVQANGKPVANAGGPYVLTEAQASHGIWTAILDGSGSSDDFAIYDYHWTFAPDWATDFAGTTLDTNTWYASSAGVSQNGVVTVIGAGNWGDRYLFSKPVFSRDPNRLIAFQARVTPVNASGNQYGMWGFKNVSTTDFNYTQMPYAIYFNNGNIYIYEDGSNRGQSGSYQRGVAYDLRITLKMTGAVYEIKRADQFNWTLLYNSNYSTASSLRIGGTVNSGTFTLDDA